MSFSLLYWEYKYYLLINKGSTELEILKWMRKMIQDSISIPQELLKQYQSLVNRYQSMVQIKTGTVLVKRCEDGTRKEGKVIFSSFMYPYDFAEDKIQYVCMVDCDEKPWYFSIDLGIRDAPKIEIYNSKRVILRDLDFILLIFNLFIVCNNRWSFDFIINWINVSKYSFLIFILFVFLL